MVRSSRAWIGGALVVVVVVIVYVLLVMLGAIVVVCKFVQTFFMCIAPVIHERMYSTTSRFQIYRYVRNHGILGLLNENTPKIHL